MGLVLMACSPPFGFSPRHVFVNTGVQVLGAPAPAALISSYAASHRALLAFDLLGEIVLAVSLIGFAALLLRLGRGDEAASTAGLVGFGAAVASAALVLVTVGDGVGIVELAPSSDYGSITSLWLAINGINDVMLLPLAIFMGVTGWMILRRRALPAWVGWYSLVIAVLIVLSGLDIVTNVTSIAGNWPFGSGGLPATTALWAVVLSFALLFERRRTANPASG
ncbi:MAG TPA: hypothetical protein VF956_11310 [Candidatus Dormibacteraeota bacterium]